MSCDRAFSYLRSNTFLIYSFLFSLIKKMEGSTHLIQGSFFFSSLVDDSVANRSMLLSVSLFFSLKMSVRFSKN